jgi:hypothetical protein
MVLYRTQRNRVNPSRVEAAGICDRCGFLYSHADLGWQVIVAGIGMVNTNLLVCPRCMDQPQRQRQAKILPPDPEPVLNARPPAWYDQEAAGNLISGGPPPPAIQPRPPTGPTTPPPPIRPAGGLGTAIPGDD